MLYSRVSHSKGTQNGILRNKPPRSKLVLGYAVSINTVHSKYATIFKGHILHNCYLGHNGHFPIGILHICLRRGGLMVMLSNSIVLIKRVNQQNSNFPTSMVDMQEV